MSRNEDGEFEMILGNRQLLSVFFIVVILLAVFFSMGYLMGRASGSGPSVAKTAPAESPAAKPEAAPPGSEVATPQPVVAAQGEQPPSELAPGQAAVSTTPAAVETPASAPVAEPAARAPEPKAADPATASTAGGPQAGQVFLQVAATTRPEAELEVDVLKKRGFPALLAPVPGGPAYRVLVGPLKDSAQLAKTKLDLEAIGFKQVIIRKY